MGFEATPLSHLPPLAWAAEIAPDLDVSAICGSAVEIDNRGLIAGAWAGDFDERAFAEAETSVGTAMTVSDGRVLASCGTAGSAPLYFCRAHKRLVASNSLAFALAAIDDPLQADNPYYLNDFCTYFYGSDRYRHTVPTAHGRLSVFYGSMAITEDRKLVAAPLADAPKFKDYETYRAYLVDQTAKIFANAAAPSRKRRYRPLATVSSGYDSSAAAVIAYEAGCRDGITFGETADQPDRAEDSGVEIGNRIGLSMRQYKTFAYRSRKDLPEVEFVAASFTAGQVFLSAAEPALEGRLIVNGLGGDWLWDPQHGRRRHQSVPFFIGGYSETEFLARVPALALALPMIGGRRMNDLDAISTGAEMRAWSVGGDYDRPIARRILEDAGVPRGTFADRKRRVAVDFFSLDRRFPALDDYFSEHSAAAFEAWFARERPMTRARRLRHRLIANSLGRLIWSGKLGRALRRVGLRWPPFGWHFLRYKTGINKNCYVFHWAVDIQRERYRRTLAAERQPS